jgi:hypothetical protein
VFAPIPRPAMIVGFALTTMTLARPIHEKSGERPEVMDGNASPSLPLISTSARS